MEPRCFTDLIDQVIRAQGFSVRKAKKIRKEIFAIWARALQRGEDIETPVGWLRVIKGPRRRLRWNKMRRKWELVNGRTQRIAFRPHPELVEVIPTSFYNEQDEALLKKLGRKPWATTVEEADANAAAMNEARMPPAPKPRHKLSYGEIMAAAQGNVPGYSRTPSAPPAGPVAGSRWRLPDSYTRSGRFGQK
jgi:hypothetical protein